MAAFVPGHIKIAAGTLYAAPLQTTEPTSCTGAWNGSWTALGFTDQGSEFDFGPAVTPVEVEEEYYPIRQAITSYSGKLTFVLAEPTVANLIIALNGAIGTGSLTSALETVNSDGSITVNPPAPGTEVRVALGWGAEFEGNTSSTTYDYFQRYVWRQCLQVGQVKRTFKKGNNKAMYACEFALEKPSWSTQLAPVQPWAVVNSPGYNNFTALTS